MTVNKSERAGRKAADMRFGAPAGTWKTVDFHIAVAAAQTE